MKDAEQNFSIPYFGAPHPSSLEGVGTRSSVPVLARGSSQGRNRHTMAERFKISTNLTAEGVAVPELVQKKVRRDDQLSECAEDILGRSEDCFTHP